MRIEIALERKLTRARTQLLLNQPFFGALCLRLKLVPASVPTMSTDGRRILYGGRFVEALKPAELEAVLAHEVLHCALGHHCRRGERDAQLWNHAADLAINPILIANGFTLPSGALIDSAFENLSAEEIYARLSQANKTDSTAAPTELQSSTSDDHGSGKQQESQSTCQKSVNESPEIVSGTGVNSGTTPARPGAFGEVLDATDEDRGPASQAEKSRQQQEWSIAADQAMRSAKACGHEPAQVERPLNESRDSRQDWRTILRDFIVSHSPSDYRWTPPNRRYIGSGLYLPSVARSGLGPIVIAVDTSGSIGIKVLEQFAGEISAIADEAQPEAIQVIYCDAAVQGSQEFQASESICLEPIGGGGTDFRPPFEWVKERQIEPVCLVYLTDLCCHSYPDPPDYPVLWVTDSRRTAPFGETLHISSQ